MTTSLTDYAAIGQAVAERASRAASKEASNCTQSFTRANKSFLGSIDPDVAKEIMQMKFQSSHNVAYTRNIDIATGAKKDATTILWSWLVAGVAIYLIFFANLHQSTDSQTAQASGTSSSTSSIISK